MFFYLNIYAFSFCIAPDGSRDVRFQSTFSHALCWGSYVLGFNDSYNRLVDVTLMGFNVKDMNVSMTKSGKIKVLEDPKKFAYCDGSFVAVFHMTAEEAKKQNASHKGQIPLPTCYLLFGNQPTYTPTEVYLEYSGHGPINTTSAHYILEGDWPGDATIRVSELLDFVQPQILNCPAPSWSRCSAPPLPR